MGGFFSWAPTTTAITQAPLDNSTKLATTAYVDADVSSAQEQMELTARGVKVWTGPFSSATAASTPASGAEIAAKVFLPFNVSITGAIVHVVSAGSTLTSSQNLVTLYNQAGTKQGSTADQSGVWTTAGSYNAAFSAGPYSLTGGPGAYCWASILSNGSAPAQFRCHSPSPQIANAGATGLLSGASLIAGRIGTSVTAPATFTPGNLATTNAAWYCIGLY